jgi:hypothetical protein
VLTPLIMSVAMLIMIPSDWHQDSAVPEIADDEVSAMTAYGASSPLPSIPAKVSLPNRQPTLSFSSGNASSCP